MNPRFPAPNLATLVALLTTGCGQMTMRTWILIDPDLSGGDVLNGTTETEDFLDAKAVTSVTEALAMGEIDFEESIDFDLGGALGPMEMLIAFTTGDLTRLFASRSTIASTMVTGPLTSVFQLDTVVTNGALPPVFDDDLLAFCGDRFATPGMGYGTYYGVDTKTTYFRTAGVDGKARDATPIRLSEIGAVPGDVLRLAPVGTWATGLSLEDGTNRRMGGVFSRGDALYPAWDLNRVAGAIDAGPELVTGRASTASSVCARTWAATTSRSTSRSRTESTSRSRRTRASCSSHLSIPRGSTPTTRGSASVFVAR